MWYYWSPNPTGFVDFLSICKSYDDYDKWDRERTEKLDNMARERKQKMEEHSKKYGSPKMTPPSELSN